MKKKLLIFLVIFCSIVITNSAIAFANYQPDDEEKCNIKNLPTEQKELIEKDKEYSKQLIQNLENQNKDYMFRMKQEQMIQSPSYNPYGGYHF